MFQSDKVFNVFAGVGVLATALFTVLGLGVASGRLQVSVSRTKSETPTETQTETQTETPVDTPTETPVDKPTDSSS